MKSDISISVDTDFLEKLKQKVNTGNPVELARIAFTLLDWAVSETEQNRLILSSDKFGKYINVLIIPELKNIK